MIEQIIIKYMVDNRRLVVPNFGAFLKKEADAEVVFVEFLKKDDGVLVSLVESEYAVAKAEAEVIVEQYVLSAKQQLARSGEFIMAKLGVMRIDANNLYNFDYNPSAAANRGANPQTVLPATPIAPTPPIPPATPVAPAAPTPMPRPTPAPAPMPQPVQQRTQPTTAAAPAKIVESDSRVETRQQPKSQSQLDLSKQQSNEQMKGMRYQKPIKSPYSTHNKKRADTIMIIAIIAALIAIGSMLYGIFADTGSDLKLRENVTVEVADSTEQAAQ